MNTEYPKPRTGRKHANAQKWANIEGTSLELGALALWQGAVVSRGPELVLLVLELLPGFSVGFLVPADVWVPQSETGCVENCSHHPDANDYDQWNERRMPLHSLNRKTLHDER